jgi:hypothetical protein
MLFFIFLLETVLETKEPTVMARQSGAPYVFYKEDEQELSAPEHEETTASVEDQDPLQLEDDHDDTSSTPHQN